MDTILSVIIPCFNAGDYIKQMLECCIRQTFKNWEVIVVDDGSTDGETKKIIIQMTKKDDRIVFLERNRLPKGGDTCRNIGFEVSKGKYVIFFDADDLISDDCFENRVKFMEENRDCDYSSFPAAYFNNGDSLPRWGKATQVAGVKHGDNDILSDLLTYNYPFTVWCNIYRRDAIQNIPWDEKVMVMQDFDWMVNCSLHNLKHKYCSCEGYDYYYRLFNDGHNVCGSFVSDEKVESSCYLFSKILDLLKMRRDYDRRRTEFFIYVIVQVERLTLDANDIHFDNFLEMCSKYYETRQLDILRRIYTSCKKRKSLKIRKLLYYRKIYRYYKYSNYLELYIKGIVKLLIGRKF